MEFMARAPVSAHETPLARIRGNRAGLGYFLLRTSRSANNLV